jgi:hypothetical protein
MAQSTQKDTHRAHQNVLFKVDVELAKSLDLMLSVVASLNEQKMINDEWNFFMNANEFCYFGIGLKQHYGVFVI